MDYGMFNVHTNVNACDCTRGCTDTRKRVCTESWHWEKNPLPHRGIEPASAACRSDVPATELHPQKTKRLAKATAGVWLPSSLPASDSLCYIRFHNKDLTSVSAYAVAISPFVTFLQIYRTRPRKSSKTQLLISPLPWRAVVDLSFGKFTKSNPAAETIKLLSKWYDQM